MCRAYAEFPNALLTFCLLILLLLRALEQQVSTTSTRELNSRGSWTQNPKSNCLMLSNDFLGSVRPPRFIQLYQ